METKPKIRLGNGKKRSASWMTATICLTEAKNHTYTYNGKEYFNININVNDQPNDFGKDVSISLNEYKKEEGSTPQANKMPASAPFVKEKKYDVPF